MYTCMYLLLNTNIDFPYYKVGTLVTGKEVKYVIHQYLLCIFYNLSGVPGARGRLCYLGQKTWIHRCTRPDGRVHNCTLLLKSGIHTRVPQCVHTFSSTDVNGFTQVRARMRPARTGSAGTGTLYP
jgi:hypothetical protein